MDYSGRTVIVTGASKGIGKAIAKRFFSLNANVIASYKSDDKGAASLKAETGKKLVLLKADVTKEADVKRVLDKAMESFGRIDVLINNAGISGSNNFWDYSLKEWNEMLSTNLTSVFLFTKYSVPYLERTKGVIINIASRIGFQEAYVYDAIPYGVSKAALLKFTHDAAKALADKGIKVNAVVPTVTKTGLIKFFSKESIERMEREKRFGTADEAADLVMELVNDPTATGKILIDNRVKF